MHGAARHLHRPGFARRDVRHGRARRQGHCRQGLRGPRPESAWGSAKTRSGLTFGVSAYLFFLRLLPPLRGTFLPFLRASESPMAIACLRLLTFLPLLPLLSVPRLRLRMLRSTSLEALREYRRAMVSPFCLGRQHPFPSSPAGGTRMEEHQTSQNCSRSRGQLTLRVHTAALVSPSCAGTQSSLRRLRKLVCGTRASTSFVPQPRRGWPGQAWTSPAMTR